jgi:translocation protein SEC63
VQTDVLLQTPSLLNALLSISMARNWFYPTIAVMHLHAYLTQALLPGDNNAAYAQLPGISESDIKGLPENVSGLEDLMRTLEEKGDARAQDIEKVVHRWGRLEVFDCSFKGVRCRIHTSTVQLSF